MHILAILVEIYSNSEAKLLTTAWTGWFVPFLHIADKVRTIAHDVLLAARDAFALGNACALRKRDGKYIATTAALGVGKLVNRVAVFVTPFTHVLVEILFGISILVLPFGPQGHDVSANA